MEIGLLVIIIILLELRLKTITNKLTHLENRFDDLKDTIKNISIQKSPEIEKVEVIQFKDLVNEILAETKTPEVIPSEIYEKDVLENKIGVEERVSSVPNQVPIEPYVPKKTWWENFREKNPDLEKFVGENLISKIGVLILVLGISYFVKYAIDKNWINETARVGIGILCGAIVMGFAHKLRANYKAFSSVLVAGAIAIFYFTIAIAFHQYHIFSQTVAFILMVIITAFSVLISVSYNRMELAIMSLIGGFSVPFMLSTGEGNYQVLFSYIAILDIGILAIAYFKKWSLVNVLAFIFTAILFGGWLTTKAIGLPNAPYLGALIFATIFYLIFTFANIINNLRTNGLFSKIELTILISNTFLYFSAGMLILANFHPELKGLFTISLALFNFICSWVLYKKFGLDKKAVYLLIGLTLTFVTLAIPIQFKGNYITLFWAAEAVMLLWLSQKSQIVHFRFTSIIVHFLMICSLIGDWKNIYTINKDVAVILFNPACIAGIFAALSLMAGLYLTKNEKEEYTLFNITIKPNIYKSCLEIALVLTLYFTGLFEINYQANQFFTSQFSSVSLPIAYHLLFSVILIFFLQKTQNPVKLKFAIGLSIVNILVYCVYFSNISFEELKENLSLINHSNIAFYLHYLSLASVLYFCFIIWNNSKKNDSLNLFKQKWFIWVGTITLAFIASSEVMLHGLTFFTKPIIIANAQTKSLAIENYKNAQTLMIKVGFPILWGIMAFIFLTIGIKKQWQNLRIVALALLGVTIVKLFVYDISNVSETGKIIAFILLGVLILVMSFAYQKIKTIVLNSESNEEPDNEKN